MIRGITVSLIQLSRESDSTPWTVVNVDNVLVAPVSEVDSAVALLPEGHRAVYHLAIPKSDTHTWEGQLVQFFGSTWSVIGIPTIGIDHQVPGPWNKKVTVELYRTQAPDLNSLWCDTVDLLTYTVTIDSEGYENRTEGTPVHVTAIFCKGVDGEIVTEGDKTGVKRTATVELWGTDYSGEQEISYDGVTYEVRKITRTGRGTVLLELVEVWR